MKGFVAALLVMLAICCIATPAAAGSGVVLSISSASVAVGETFSIQVRLATGSHVISGGQFVLSFDRSLLSVSGSGAVRPGEMLDNAWILLTNHEHPGGVSVVWASGSSLLRDMDGPLITVEFRATKAGTTQIDLTGITLRDADVVAIPNVSASVGAVAISLPPTPVTPPAVTPPPPAPPTPPAPPLPPIVIPAPVQPPVPPAPPEPPAPPIATPTPVPPPTPITPPAVTPPLPVPPAPTPPVVLPNPVLPLVEIRAVLGSRSFAINGAQQMFDSFTMFVSTPGVSVMALRLFAEFGAQIDYDWTPLGGYITITHGSSVIRLRENSDIMQIIEDGRERTVRLRTAVINRYGRAFIPVRDVSEHFGFMVEWNYVEDSVTIRGR